MSFAHHIHDDAAVFAELKAAGVAAGISGGATQLHMHKLMLHLSSCAHPLESQARLVLSYYNRIAAVLSDDVAADLYGGADRVAHLKDAKLLIYDCRSKYQNIHLDSVNPVLITVAYVSDEDDVEPTHFFAMGSPPFATRATTINLNNKVNDERLRMPWCDLPRLNASPARVPNGTGGMFFANCLHRGPGGPRKRKQLRCMLFQTAGPDNLQLTEDETEQQVFEFTYAWRRYWNDDREAVKASILRHRHVWRQHVDAEDQEYLTEQLNLAQIC